jgi:hypothetical protein
MRALPLEQGVLLGGAGTTLCHTAKTACHTAKTAGNAATNGASNSPCANTGFSAYNSMKWRSQKKKHLK